MLTTLVGRDDLDFFERLRRCVDVGLLLRELFCFVDLVGVAHELLEMESSDDDDEVEADDFVGERRLRRAFFFGVAGVSFVLLFGDLFSD